MKRVLSIIAACSLLICTCSVSGIVAAHETEEDKWSELIENFNPNPFVEDEGANSESPVKPKMSAELKKAIEEADPLSQISYDLETGEVSLIPYVASEKNNAVETPPSQ